MNPTTYTDDEIKALLSLIRKAKLEIPYPANNASLDVKRAFVSDVVNKFGEPHEIAEEDTELLSLKNVPDHEDGFKVGDIVFLPNLGSGVNNIGDVPPLRDPLPDTPPHTTFQQPTPPSPPTERRFRGRVILSTDNSVINGKVYVRVTTSTETYTVSQAEFDADVTNS